ncbi:MAG: hypothetical protein R3D32_09730 [Nitratireductor sp.]
MSAARRAQTRRPIPRLHADPRLVCTIARGRARLPAGLLLVQCQGWALRSLPGRRADQDRDALPAGCLCHLRCVPRQTLQSRNAGSAVQGQVDCRRAGHDGRGSRAFAAVPSVREKFETLERVGLGYIHVGQQATTLSGGEAQRIKLSKELSRRATGRTLYILDEPTTGLHFHDVKKLLEVLHELVDQGNTVIVIEHNLEVIKTADWILDLGPEGGDGGGELVAVGTPEDIVKEPRSHTGAFLKELLERRPTGKKRQAAE